VKTIPVYADAQHPRAALTPGGPANYSNGNSWYEQHNARTAIGLANRNRTLVLFTVDRASGSLGLSLGEVADLLIRDYAVRDALNLDGGGSTTMVVNGVVVNVPSDSTGERPVSDAIIVRRR
jgi:exopolysaccharide biosynthesis protein